jgi:uncharacterized protein YbjT (DUF2867 family)
MQLRKICLIGGTGFVGGNLATELARRGYALKILTRRRERNRDMLVFPRIDLVETDVHYVSNLTEAIGDCDAVINTVGVLNPEGDSTFSQVHAELPGKIAEACEYHRISRIIHVSALGAAEDAPSEYLRTKWAGEQSLLSTASRTADVSIFRPAVIFGPGDSFFNRFAQILALKPLVFPLASPGTRLQPVFVGDVTQAICDALENRSTFGNTYELAGPDAFTLRELVEYTARLTGVSTRIWELPTGLAQLQARVFERLPGKPFSTDNLRSLSVDNVSQKNALGEFNITPTGIDAVVPGYLGQARKSARYQVFRRTAGR